MLQYRDLVGDRLTIKFIRRLDPAANGMLFASKHNRNEPIRNALVQSEPKQSRNETERTEPNREPNQTETTKRRSRDPPLKRRRIYHSIGVARPTNPRSSSLFFLHPRQRQQQRLAKKQTQKTTGESLAASSLASWLASR